jgi:predicted acylesterase/phospholipase RssA
MSRALVLSGGGSVGVAWETGVVLGLAERGVDLTAADLVLGTSAGSTVGAQLALGHDLHAHVERYRTAGPRFMARFLQEEKLLAESGAQVESILPDEGAAAVMGVDLLDPSVMPAAIDEGIRQGKAAAATLVDFWT